MCSFSKKLVFVLVTIVCILKAYGQSAADISKKIMPELLKQDFSVLKDSLQALHPGLYRYKTHEEINNAFDYCYLQLNKPLALTEFFAVISRLINNIEDGHTECFLPKEAINEMISNVKIFPVQIRFIGNKAYIPCNTKEFNAGAEITAIDDTPIDEIRKQLFLLLSSDGSIQTGKYIKINDGHDPFSYLYDVVYGENSAFKVSYKTASGQIKTKMLVADYFQNMQCPPSEVHPDHYLNLEYRSGGIAVMTIKTFANEYLENTKENFENFMAASFKKLADKKINKLIIDLRENGGGEDSNGLLLYRYLTALPFYYYASLSSTKMEDHNHPNLKLQQPESPNFLGKVEFLISGQSFSGAAEFSSIARSNGRGLFIGEETGGGYYGNTSGGKATLVLPNSKIRVNIPTRKYVMAVKKVKYKDRGTIPDYIIVPGIDDYLQHKDVQMNFAIKLLNRK